MNRNPVYIVDILNDVVTATDAALKEDEQNYLFINGKTLNYIYGDGDEINKRLQLLTNNQSSKYPLIAVIMPFAEEYNELVEVTISKLIIATVTPKDMLFPQRYEEFFKPVLYPVYYMLLEQLTHKTVESDPAVIAHTKADVPRIVPNDKDGLTNDYVDAIVIQNLKFKIFSPLNC